MKCPQAGPRKKTSEWMTSSTSFLKVIMQDIAIPHEICLQLLGVKVTHLMYSSRIKKYTKSLQMTSTIFVFLLFISSRLIKMKYFDIDA